MNNLFISLLTLLLISCAADESTKVEYTGAERTLTLYNKKQYENHYNAPLENHLYCSIGSDRVDLIVSDSLYNAHQIGDEFSLFVLYGEITISTE